MGVLGYALTALGSLVAFILSIWVMVWAFDIRRNETNFQEALKIAVAIVAFIVAIAGLLFFVACAISVVMVATHSGQPIFGGPDNYVVIRGY